MSAAIRDEFEHKPISRQVRYQKRKLRDRKCQECGAPAVSKNYCEKHRVQTNTVAREGARARLKLKRRYHGAEYCHGEGVGVISSLQNFPKWLLSESFRIEWDPGIPRFHCYLISRKSAGVGGSVCQAAKDAMRNFERRNSI